MSKTTGNANRDFPATSIGRSSGPRFLNSLSPSSAPGTQPSLSRTSSRESLNIAHPLLSTSPTSGISPSSSTTNLSATAWDNGFSSGASGATPALGYVPYTPRHRPPSSHLSHAHSPTSASSSPSVLVTPAVPATNTQTVVNRNAVGGGATHTGDATSKLQLMNLKSAAQGLGLDAGSIGWAIVERLVGIVGSSDEREEEEWREIWSALHNGKATLLLPLDPLSSLGAHISVSRHDKDSNRPRGSVINAQFISPSFVKNHVVFCDPVDKKDTGITQVVTLSGIRGSISSTNPTTQSASVTFDSTLHPSTKLFKEISQPGTRAAAFASLLPPYPDSLSTSRYPTYTLPTHTDTFTLPPQSPNFPIDPNKRKPPLPPRRPVNATSPPSGQRPSTPSGSGGRLAGLVSLFGRSSSSVNTSQLSTSPASTDGLVAPAPAPAPSSRPPSILSVSDKASIEEDAGIAPSSSSSLTVPAYAISTSIHSNEVLKGLWVACVRDVKDRLNAASQPDDFADRITTPSLVVDRVLEFMDQEGVFPVLRVPARTEMDAGGSIRPIKGRKNSEKDRYEVNGYGGELWRDIEQVAERWQLFFVDLEDELRAAPQNKTKSKSRSTKEKRSQETTVDESEKESLVSGSVSVSGSEKDDDPDEKSHAPQNAEEKEEEEEKRVREIMERVEKVACTSCGIFGRLFPQPSPQCSQQPDDHEDEATDTAHDEALASRIAALNLVDIGLSDLDIDPPSSKEQEDALLSVLNECGGTLSMLEDAHCPRDKAAVLVKAHRVLVDGLGNLSEAVRMKSEDDIALGEKEKKEEVNTSLKETSVLGGEEVTSPQAVEGGSLPPAVPESAIQPDAIPSETSIAATDHKSEPANSQQTLSLDTLFPLLILSAVKANPPRLISHLLYTQRFRNRSFGGEEAYCLVNLMAVAEFIGALDPATVTSNRLGLISTPGSGPIPIPAPNSRPGSRLSMIAQVPLPGTPAGSVASTSALSSTSFTLRHRVEQQVDALSNSANKVITGVTGVVDTSFGIFKSFTLPTLKVGSQADLHSEVDGPVAPWNEGKGTLVRRDTGGFSIRGLKLPGLGGGSVVGGKAKEEEMISVSRPGSVRSRKSAGSRMAASDYDSEEDDDDNLDEDDVSDGEGESGSEEDGSEEEAEEGEGYFSGPGGDARSIKSFESMMSSRQRASKKAAHSGRSAREVAGAARKSLSDRLAKVSSGIGGVTKTGSGSNVKLPSPQSSLLLGTSTPTNRFDVPVASSRPQSPVPQPVSLRLAPPSQRLLECTSADELRLKDVAELLREYKRLVDGVRSVGGFVEDVEAGV
ncbi:hypothetical protein AAF712_007896 [Marasmius tenuissimus]|uniref:VPS9 domain-containing protein n=1 Tax=Marasmius tenuissimus TaxID=585030 RepID=A0ABR2ZUU9_9AGAR